MRYDTQNDGDPLRDGARRKIHATIGESHRVLVEPDPTDPPDPSEDSFPDGGWPWTILLVAVSLIAIIAAIIWAPHR